MSNKTTDKFTFVMVEDHTFIAQVTTLSLERNPQLKSLGFFDKLTTAAAALPTLKPNLVIIDWQLRKHTAVDLMKQVRHQIPDTKWLLFTAWPMSWILNVAVPEGISGCVSKGASDDQLTPAALEIAAGGSYYCPESMRNLTLCSEPGVKCNFLTATEREILQKIAAALEPKQIGDALGLTPKTIYNYLSIIRRKLRLNSMVELRDYAVSEGIA